MNRVLVNVAAFVNLPAKEVDTTDRLTRIGVHITRQDLKYRLEKFYGVHIEPADALKWETVSDVIDYMKQEHDKS